MSSNRGDLMIRYLPALGLAACLATGLTACASNPTKLAAAPPATPTQQYKIAVTREPDEILLAPHADGLSARQAAAVDDFFARWREAGGKVVLIVTPTAGGADAYRTAAAVEARLEQQGVDPAQIELVGYDAGPGPGPIKVSFQRYRAVGPQCGRSWTNLTHTIDNEVDPNFGCATTANLAAMIANPEDLVHPQTTTDPDPVRRNVVHDEYRMGTPTSTAADEQANGAISSAVQ